MLLERENARDTSGRKKNRSLAVREFGWWFESRYAMEFGGCFLAGSWFPFFDASSTWAGRSGSQIKLRCSFRQRAAAPPTACLSLPPPFDPSLVFLSHPAAGSLCCPQILERKRRPLPAKTALSGRAWGAAGPGCFARCSVGQAARR